MRLVDPRLRYAAVTQVTAPSAVHLGDPLPVRVTVRSSVAEPATLYLLRDGTEVSQQTIHLRQGDNPLLLSYTASGLGWHSFQVRVVLFSDDLTENDERGATVHVVAAPRALVVAGGWGWLGGELDAHAAGLRGRHGHPRQASHGGRIARPRRTRWCSTTCPRRR